MNENKKAVQKFWEQTSCGEDLYLDDGSPKAYADQAQRRYELEPFIEQFAGFGSTRDKKVLEIGVGLGADHQRFAEAGAVLTGIDITERAIEHVRHRLSQLGLSSTLSTGDAENLHFEDDSYDIVYSWGVIHHSPDTHKAVAEIHRVLRPGGIAKVMVYHTWSLVGYMLWMRYALLRFRPWMTLAAIYSRYLESPGTKAYSVRTARQLFVQFHSVEISTVLTHGDLLESAAGQRHSGALLKLARRAWPRSLLRRCAQRQGLFMLITAVK